jgi:transposase
MYLRTTKRKNKDGSVVEYFQLAHNKRHPENKRPVAHIIHSFGRADQLDRDDLVRLCRSIARVCGLEISDLSDSDQSEKCALAAGADLPGDVKLIRTLGFGCVMVIETLWERLGIGKNLRNICKANRLDIAYERALFAMTANGLCEPESKLGAWDKWLSKVYLPSCRGLKLDQMYEAMDMLFYSAAKIEQNVYFHTADLLNFQTDLIFYDTITASFSIDQEDEAGLRRFGRVKEGSWGQQVVVALAVTREGLPVRCWVFPGNTTEEDTMERVRKDLRGLELSHAQFAADAGMNSEKNQKELGRACGKYLIASRMASVSEIRDNVFSKRGSYTEFTENLHAKEVIIGDGECRKRYILCYNLKEAERQKKHRSLAVEFLEKELAKHPDKIATARWAIELLASKRYKRYLSISKSGQVHINQDKIRKTEKYDGKRVMETNDDTISLEDAVCGYKGLMIIERCFRSLKRTQIKMSPMYHWLPRHIETHVRICVLALLIERVAELACQKPWHQIRAILDGLQSSEFQTPNHRFFKLNEASGPVRDVLEMLGIPLPSGVLGLQSPAESQSKL